ncbi:MAG: phosphatase PAP2 family protein [Dehalococcoidia bacterium]
MLAVAATLIVRGRAHWGGRIALRQAIIIVSGVVIYFGVRHLTEGDEVAALRHARSLFDFEQALGIARESDMQQSFADTSCGVRVLNWVYIWWHWPVIFMSAVWLLLWHRHVYYRYRNAILISGALGLIVFAMYPVAPPRLVPDLGVVDTVTAHSSAYRVLQPPAFTNQFAAMPSLHFGWNLLIGLAIAKTGRGLLRVGGILMPAAMFVAVVATANHFIIDAIAGAALALLGLVLASHGASLFARLRPSRGSDV